MINEILIEGGVLVAVHGGSGLAAEGVPGAKRGMVVHSTISHADGDKQVRGAYRLTVRAVKGTDLWRVTRLGPVTALTRNELTFLGWGLIGEPQEGMIVQTGNGRGIDVTGYYEGDYWGGPDASDFKGPDPYGVVPVYEMPDGGIFPAGATQYSYTA